MSKSGKRPKKKKNSEYDKRKLVDLCKITNDKSYEIRDEQNGGGGFLSALPREPCGYRTGTELKGTSTRV